MHARLLPIVASSLLAACSGAPEGEEAAPAEAQASRHVETFFEG